MYIKTLTYYFLLFFIISSCSSQQKKAGGIYNYHFNKKISPQKAHLPNISWEKKDWVELKKIAPSIVYDIKYAGKENFVHQKIYPCAKCFLRPEVAKALAQVQKELQKNGYGLIVFDCYRPLTIQQKLWQIKPDPNYVADPTKGSMHNRGLAVDISIIDQDGKELDMGTPFDAFTIKAHSDYQKLPEKTLHNRKMLYEIMHKYGMEPIRTEWWHFSYRKKKYPLSRWIWDCN